MCQITFLSSGSLDDMLVLEIFRSDFVAGALVCADLYRSNQRLSRFLCSVTVRLTSFLVAGEVIRIVPCIWCSARSFADTDCNDTVYPNVEVPIICIGNAVQPKSCDVRRLHATCSRHTANYSPIGQRPGRGRVRRLAFLQRSIT